MTETTRATPNKIKDFVAKCLELDDLSRMTLEIQIKALLMRQQIGEMQAVK